METTKKNIQESTSSNMLIKIWSYYFAYWPIFGIVLISCLLAAWVFMRYSSPVYAATATVLIKDEQKGIADSKMIESLNLITDKKIIENEIEVIKSRTLINEVVDKLFLYAPVYHSGKLKSQLAYDNSPIKIEAQNPDSLIEAKKIDFDYHFDGKDSLITIGPKEYPLNTWSKTDFGVLRFIANPYAKANTVQHNYYFALINPQKVVEDMLLNLDVLSLNKLSSVLTIQVKDQIPKRAEDILNELLLSYNKASLQAKNYFAENTFRFIEERLKIVGSDLDSIEHRIQTYKAEKGVTDISAEGRLFLEKVSSNDQRLGDYKIQQAVLDQIETEIINDKKLPGTNVSTLGITDPLLTDLLTKLNDQEVQFEKLRQTTASNNPILISVKAQIDQLKKTILYNIASQKRNLHASKSNLSNTNSSYLASLTKMPKKEKDLIEISREQNIINSIYSFLIQKREEAALSYSLNVADNRIVDKAKTLLLPISPNAKIIYLLSIVISFVATITVISAKEMFSSRILYRKEIEDLTIIPVIGEIQLKRSKGSIVVENGKIDSVSEQFRKLRTSLKFININKERKRILVTSSIPKEGKSFVSLNLGIVLSLTGKRVVLLELDLVNPSLSSKIGIQSTTGLTSFLESTTDACAIIKPTTINSNLFIIPSGQLPANPTELLMNGRIEKLLHDLELSFDFIIIDSAPIGSLSDAYIVSPLCDATLYIIRHKYTPKNFIKRLEEEIKINQLKNVAIVFNAVTKRGYLKRSSYDYGYNSNYQYHYQYRNVQ